MKRPVMVQGCTSGAGKSLLVAGLCRALANRGERVVPFKAQNISNYAAVTSEGGEMSRAQWLQALAARVEPAVQMNPVLIKPGTHGHIIVLGKPAGVITNSWPAYCQETLWPVIRGTLRTLMGHYDRVVIEGAGSPAEINLRSTDISNMRVALEAGADVFLVADIEKGGAFAHLLGTFLSLEPDERRTIKGFVINRSNGSPAQLQEGMEWLRAKTGVPTVAVIPAIKHSLPEEDTPDYRAGGSAERGRVEIALICYPNASNLDEFDPLIAEEGVRVQMVRAQRNLSEFSGVILPGSRDTVASLQFLREIGMASEISQAAARGTLVLVVCGGMQLLGNRVHDPLAIESGDAAGLGLLDLETTLEADKVTRQVAVRTAEGIPVKGYEIHHGRTQAGSKASPFLEDRLGWKQGNVVGVCVHGLFENAEFRRVFLEGLGWRGSTWDWNRRMEADLERIAEAVAPLAHCVTDQGSE